MSNHETHVYQSGRRWLWNCPCGAESETSYARRMDADDSASCHADRVADDDEVFCPDCCAGMESSEHHEKCEVPARLDAEEKRSIDLHVAGAGGY